MADTTSRFVWYELMTRDAPSAQSFYTSVVGWTAEVAGGPHADYHFFLAGGTQVAGLMVMPAQAEAAGAPPGWRGFIGVADTDAMTDRVTGNGATLRYGPEDIPGVGRFASLTDPQGAPFLLFTPAPGSERRGLDPQTPGSIGWHELHASDATSAWSFYAGPFGWTKADAIDMGSMGIYQTFTMGGAGGGMMTRVDPAQPPHWLFYITVDSIAAAADRVRRAGGTVIREPHQVPGGTWILQGLDAQGVQFALSGPP